MSPTNAVYLKRSVSLPAKSTTSTRSRWVCEQCRFRHGLAIFRATQFVQLRQVSVVKNCCGKLIAPAVVLLDTSKDTGLISCFRPYLC